jgi:hypothetical protein
MITHSTSPVSHTWHLEEKYLGNASTLELPRRGRASFSGRHIVKWCGAFSTILLLMAALAPGAFRIPASLEPWVFLIASLWFFAFCAGLFDL